ncbi:MAG: hypothetical protein KC417_07095 [Myxococcales bacterium]|nr:hypothetical protein [Myxococcales bacterium]
MRIDADVIIAGAGCAGLSLARRLVPMGPSVALVDPRTHYDDDRTWCFWAAGDHPFRDLVSHRWARWAVSAGADVVVREAAPYFYERLPAGAFYADSETRLAGAPNLAWHRGVRVLGASVDASEAHVAVETSAGVLRAKRFVDTRPTAPWAPMEGRGPALTQRFVGWTVRTAAPAFDPSTAILMAFGAPDPRGVAFTYVLPLSTRGALLEDTWFTAGEIDADEHRARLRAELHRRGIADAEILREERGALPMAVGRFAPRTHWRIAHAGLVGGAARPATGYAFQAIQRQTAALADELRDPNSRPARIASPRPAWIEALDATFLEALRADPTAAPDLFLRLFRRVPADALVRFLSETARPSDALHVIRALPVSPLSKAAFRAYFSSSSP